MKPYVSPKVEVTRFDNKDMAATISTSGEGCWWVDCGCYSNSNGCMAYTDVCSGHDDIYRP